MRKLQHLENESVVLTNKLRRIEEERDSTVSAFRRQIIELGSENESLRKEFEKKEELLGRLDHLESGKSERERAQEHFMTELQGEQK
jgi:hypothetical protein